ncbi:hypothetical protein BAC7755_47910 [Bacillus sp. MN7755]|uniref:Uncharacterized protein n=2 Tax=Bacillus cereus group TaxID=86661 RepID=A0A2B0X6G8_BACAN|nr:Mobile element protein [Bacillus cereus]PFL61598.1 hypothetical protein COJ30_18855 [Bacillus anthracis]
MPISVSDELQLFAQEIQSFLSPNTLRDLARDVGFARIDAFFELCMVIQCGFTHSGFFLSHS